MLLPVKKEYGQHFLADRNILDVIGRLAELGPEDVVLEIGPGGGVLTRYLAEHVRGVHAIEIDRGLEPGLSDLPANVADVSSMIATAMNVMKSPVVEQAKLSVRPTV